MKPLELCATNLDPRLAKDRGISGVNATEIRVSGEIAPFNSKQFISLVLAEYGQHNLSQNFR